MLKDVEVEIAMPLATCQIGESASRAIVEAKIGATKIRRLSRGSDLDRIERIYQSEPYARVKYGVGENRYIFST